ncbi:MAG: hypothetical protein ACO1PI_04620 [Bacteroidota bacterium]
MGNKILLVSKNLSTLKDEYMVSEKVMKKWLRKVPNLQVDERDTKDYTPKEIELIYKHLGVPGKEFEEQ